MEQVLGRTADLTDPVLADVWEAQTKVDALLADHPDSDQPEFSDWDIEFTAAQQRLAALERAFNNSIF